jgi:predicted ArsR family transcriptional regulator
LFRYIAEADGPVSIRELTEYVQLNHNAVRQHLTVLKGATLVSEEVEVRTQPGRPRLLYRIHPEAAGKWQDPGPYAWLAGLLSKALSQSLSPRNIGRLEGRRIASESARNGDAADLLERDLTRRGFRPSRSERGRRLEFVLGRCPFSEVAVSDPDTICQLHLGLAEGLVDGLGDSVERLVAKNPYRAGCRLIIRRSPAS